MGYVLKAVLSSAQHPEYDEYMESSFIGMMGAEDETGEEICTGMMM